MCLFGCTPSSSSGSGFTGPITCTAGCPNHPPYDPALWNNPPVIGSTNCYAYAANDPHGHPPGKPQPGQKCGSPAKDATCAEIDRAARCDGMISAPNPPTPRPGYYPVALVMDPGVDYHWYRLDNNGRWSHKPGNTPATDLDASGNPITNRRRQTVTMGELITINSAAIIMFPLQEYEPDLKGTAKFDL